MNQLTSPLGDLSGGVASPYGAGGETWSHCSELRTLRRSKRCPVAFVAKSFFVPTVTATVASRPFAAAPCTVRWLT